MQNIENFDTKELALGWIGSLKRRGLSTNTVSAYTRDFFSMMHYFSSIVDDFSIVNISNLKPRDLRTWMTYMEKEKNMNALSRARALSSVRSFFKYFEEKTGLVCSGISAIRRPAAGVRIPRAPEKQDLSLLRKKLSSFSTESWESDRNDAIFMLMYGCGLRISEVVNLTDKDFDFESNLVLVKGKGSRERMLPMLPIVADSVRRAMNSVPRKNDLIFQGKRKNNFSRNSFALIFKKARDAAGMPSFVTPHSLRHAFATHMIGAGAKIREVQELLGHSSLSSTQIYSGVNDEAKIRAASLHPRSKLKIYKKS